ncbi:hypothetical protein QQ045_012180 [Rhodiola kirilowii]
MEKEVKKGIKKIESERTVFNDEEQRRSKAPRYCENFPNDSNRYFARGSY